LSKPCGCSLGASLSLLIPNCPAIVYLQAGRGGADKGKFTEQEIQAMDNVD
jgi:hypothetical protein